jgi:hypothetical protein
LSGGGDNLDHNFTTAGVATGDTIDTSPWVGAYPADMTYNPFTNTLWQVNVGGDNCIYELDPASKVDTGNKICPPFGTSERGLAFDPLTNTYYAGSWNDGIINHFAPDGTLLDAVDVGLDIAGLAFNPSTGHLFVSISYPTVSGGANDIYVLDAKNGYAVIGGIDIMDGGVRAITDYDEKGLEIDCNGDLWLQAHDTGISDKVISFASGETGVCDWQASWLTTAPTSGNVAAHGSSPVNVNVDSTSLATGAYTAYLRVVNNTPYGDEVLPVTLLYVENHAPTSLELSNRFIQEERPAGVIIGALTSTDPDPADTVTYSLADTVACPGTDNGYFAVNGTDLVTSGAPRIDFQTKYYLSVCLRVTDLGGLTFDQPVTIVVRSIHQFPMDTNGDGKDDYVTFRPITGTWHLRNNPPIITFGQNGDLPVAADYNGDGKDDIAVFRPAAIGTWYIRNQGVPINFGAAGDVPLPLDYNGDGKDDIAVFRPATGTWHIRGQVLTLAFGQLGDIPVPADYNGDGKADIAVFRPATGTWHVRNQATITFGQDGDIPVPADYNNDGKADIAVYRPSTGTWYIRKIGTVNFGGMYDLPFPMHLQNATTLNYVVIHTGPGMIEWRAQGLPTINFGAVDDVHQ